MLAYGWLKEEQKAGKRGACIGPSYNGRYLIASYETNCSNTAWLLKRAEKKLKTVIELV